MEKRRNTRRRRRSSERVLMIMLLAVVLIGCAVGGTIAYFTDQTDAVTNTFVVGDIGDLTLSETGASLKDGSTTEYEKQFVIVPGVAISKDPKLTYVNAQDSYEPLPAYVYVKVENTSKAGATAAWVQNGTDNKDYSVTIDGNKVIYWTVADGWTALPGYPNVFYRAVGANEKLGDGEELANGVSIIADDTINVSDEITMQNIGDVADVVQTIKFTAYAVQQGGFTDAAAAWLATFGAPATP